MAEPVRVPETFERSARGALIGAAVSAALLGASGVLVSRLLGPEGKGEVSVGIVLGAGLGTLAAGGVDVWIAGALRKSGWTSGVRGVLLRQAALACAAIAVTLAVSLALGVASGLAIGIAVLAIGYIIALIGLGTAAGAGRSSIIALSHVLTGVVSLGAVAALVAFDLPEVGLVIICLGVGRIIGGMVGLTAIRSRAASDPHLSHSDWSAIGFGLRTALGSTLALGIYRADTLLVAFLHSAEAAGIYSVAATLTELLWVVPDALSALVVSNAASGAAPSHSAQIVRASLAIVVGGGVTAAVAAPILVPLVFGDAFRSASGLVVPLVAAAGLLTIWKLLVADLAGRGDGATRLHSIASGLATMVVVATVLIPLVGTVGAAFATLAGYGMAAGMAVRSWTRHGGRPRDLVLLTRTDVRQVLGQLSRQVSTPSVAWWRKLR